MEGDADGRRGSELALINAGIIYLSLLYAKHPDTFWKSMNRGKAFIVAISLCADRQ